MGVSARLSAPPEGPSQEDHFVHLRGVSCEDDEGVLRMRGEASAPRVALVDGVLEIMSPSIHHESVNSNLAALLEV